jgi:hypothetical protein
VRFSDVNKTFFESRGINYFVSTFIIELKANFHLNDIENRVLICFPSKFTDPLKYTHGLKVKNRCLIGRAKFHWNA